LPFQYGQPQQQPLPLSSPNNIHSSHICPVSLVMVDIAERPRLQLDLRRSFGI
jgi:hypothetical protein